MIIKSNGSYILIDAEYIKDFSDYHGSINETNLVRLRRELFPDAYDPFAVIEIDANQLILSNIIYLDFEETNVVDLRQFCSDSGMILVINFAVFDSFRSRFNVKKFVDYIFNPTMSDYWLNLQHEYQGEVYFFYTSDIDPEFAGGGNFKINV